MFIQDLDHNDSTAGFDRFHVVEIQFVTLLYYTNLRLSNSGCPLILDAGQVHFWFGRVNPTLLVIG